MVHKILKEQSWTMLKPSQIRSLILAENYNSELLANNVVKSESEFHLFEDIARGIPILIPADREIFHYESENVFALDLSQLFKIIYGADASNYIGYKNSFSTNYFLSSFQVRDEFTAMYEEIEQKNLCAIEYVKSLCHKHGKVGAFQTRNIPHFGHQRIMERMLDFCDHLVINPVLGPKKSGDASEECLKKVFGDFFKSRFGGRVSFMPIFSNMFYAGPREAVHHAIIRRNMGFTHFTVGRDHAGAEGFYKPEEAPKLISSLQHKLGIEVFCHMGAKFCKVCDSFVIVGECGHAAEKMCDVSGSQFRKAIVDGKFFEFANKDMQKYVFQNIKNIIER